MFTIFLKLKLGQLGHIAGWRAVFNSAAAIYVFGIIFFLIFATAKPQAWGVLATSRKATRILTRQNSRRAASRALSRQVSRTPLSFPSTPEPDARNAAVGFCTVNLNTDINEMLQSLSDRIEVGTRGYEDGLPSIGELEDGTLYRNSSQSEGAFEVDSEEEEAIEQEERLQHFRERRYTILP